MVYKRFYNSEEARIQYIIEVLEYIVKDKEYYRSTMTLTEGQEGENRCNNTFICCFSTTDRAVDSSTHCTVSLQIFQSAVGSVDCNVHKPQSDEGSMNQAGYRNTFVLLLHSRLLEDGEGGWEVNKGGCSLVIWRHIPPLGQGCAKTGFWQKRPVYRGAGHKLLSLWLYSSSAFAWKEDDVISKLQQSNYRILLWITSLHL